MARAIVKDDAVRCEECEEEVWEGTVCGCGVENWEGIDEAYALLQKQEAGRQTREENESRIEEKIFELTSELAWERERDEKDDEEVLYALFGNYNYLQFQSEDAIENAANLTDEEFLDALKEAKAARDKTAKEED